MDLPGKHRLRMDVTRSFSEESDRTDGSTVTLSEAVSIYLEVKGAGRPKTFHRAADRCCGYVIDVCGAKHVLSYTKANANAVRDHLLSRGMAGGSITRTLGTVRAVMNFAASEMDLALTNPFTGIHYDRDMGVEERQPLSADDVRLVEEKCRRIDHTGSGSTDGTRRRSSKGRSTEASPRAMPALATRMSSPPSACSAKGDDLRRGIGVHVGKSAAGPPPRGRAPRSRRAYPRADGSGT